MSKVPVALKVAHLAGRVLPPVGAHLVACPLYSWHRAGREGLEVERRALTGSLIRVDMADEHGYWFGLLGFYDWKIWAISRYLCTPGDTVVEVGANIGTETVALADIVGSTGKVIAFEPLPANLERLRRNTSALPWVDVRPFAVSDAPGRMAFVTPDNVRQSGTGYLEWNVGGSDHTTVEATTLDLHLATSHAARLLLMDVEGAEVRVLKGAARWIRRLQPAIITEANAAHQIRAGFSASALLKTLESLGYAVRAIRRLGLSVADDSETIAGNWLALPVGSANAFDPIDRFIKRCGLLPPWRGVSPLVLHRR